MLPSGSNTGIYEGVMAGVEASKRKMVFLELVRDQSTAKAFVPLITLQQLDTKLSIVHWIQVSTEETYVKGLDCMVGRVVI